MVQKYPYCIKKCFLERYRKGDIIAEAPTVHLKVFLMCKYPLLCMW